jgi:hypothetical protein
MRETSASIATSEIRSVTMLIVYIRAGQHAAHKESICGPQLPEYFQ